MATAEQLAVSDELIDRAVELWRRELRSPKFDNGDRSESGAMATMLATVAAKPIVQSDLDRFCEVLRRHIVADLERCPGYVGMYVDYGPDHFLYAVQEEAGVKLNFPWKSSINISTTAVGVSIGYHAATKYHYPMGDGRWLITNLTGAEMPALIDAVREDASLAKRLGLVIEEPPAAVV